MKPLAPNSMIQNRYLIVHPIGKGGMGEVYLAVDQRLGSAVALKRTFFSEDDALANAFEREARILARLRHPVLPKVIDHFMENGDQFLVMEHISGDDLSKRLENANKPFPLSWVMFWADQMLDALSYLHSHEPPIIHRDIKPQNMKLTDENHIVLLDFGLSKDFDTGSSSQPLASGSVVGYSPHFASMEQVRGTGTDARSDLYSLSATIYQLMTNVVPADSLSRADSLLGSGKDPIRPINEINPEVSSAVSDVILKGLSVRQDARYSSAGEMQKALRRAFNQGKEDADQKEIIAADELPVVEAKSSPLASDASEMATRMRTDEAVPGMDETLQMDVSPAALNVQQSDIQTAVLTPADIAAPAVEVSAPKVTVAEPEPESPKTEAPTAVAAAGGSAGPSKAFTVPVSGPESSSKPKIVAAAPAKKGKGGLLVGALIGLIVLGGVVGGGGWFFYNKMYGGVKATPSPTPVAAATPTPAIITTVSPTDSNTEISNGTNANQSTIPNATPETTGSKQQSVSTKPTPTKSQAPVTKATPKAKAKDERTTILQ